MEVTIKNFPEMVEVFEEKLKTCTYIAFDEKLSGQDVDDTTEPDYLDSPEMRYHKTRKIASTFNILQMGLCLFHKQQDGSFVGTPFSFFLFPPETSTMRLQMDPGVVHWHKENGMDFNKWVREGIPFMPDDVYMQRREQILEYTVNKDDPEWRKRRIQVESPEDKQFVASTMANLDAWVKKRGLEGSEHEKQGEGEAPGGGPSQGRRGRSNTSSGASGAGSRGSSSRQGPAHQEIPEGTEYTVPECNAQLTKALYQEIEDRYPFLSLEMRAAKGGSQQKNIVANFKTQKDGSIEKYGKDKAQQLAVLDRDSAFRRVYVGLVECKKPIVGHNCLYDLVFLCRHCESNLPQSYQFWKKSVHRRFPIMYDTKALAVLSGNFSDTNLENLYDQAMAQEGGTQVLVDGSVGEYPKADAPRDAGLDAWMTGAIFARIGGPQLLDSKMAQANSMFCCRTFFILNLVGRDTLQPGVVHLTLPKKTAEADLKAMLGIPDRLPMRVTNVPARVTDGELKKFFSGVGPVAAAVVVPGADDKSTGTGFVLFKDAKHMQPAIESAEKEEGTSFGKGDDKPMHCETVKVGPLRWITAKEVFISYPGCTDEESIAILQLIPHQLGRAVPLRQYLEETRPELLDEVEGDHTLPEATGRGGGGRKRKMDTSPMRGGGAGKMSKQERGGIGRRALRGGGRDDMEEETEEEETEEEGEGFVGRGRGHGQMSIQERGRKGVAVKNERLRQGYYDRSRGGRGQQHQQQRGGGGRQEEEETEEEDQDDTGYTGRGRGQGQMPMQERGKKGAAVKNQRLRQGYYGGGGGQGRGHGQEEEEYEDDEEQDEGYTGRGRGHGRMSMQERGRKGAAVKNERLRQGQYDLRRGGRGQKRGQEEEEETEEEDRDEGGYVGQGRSAGQSSMRERGRRGAAVKNEQLRQGHYGRGRGRGRGGGQEEEEEDEEDDQGEGGGRGGRGGQERGGKGGGGKAGEMMHYLRKRGREQHTDEEMQEGEEEEEEGGKGRRGYQSKGHGGGGGMSMQERGRKGAMVKSQKYGGGQSGGKQQAGVGAKGGKGGGGQNEGGTEEEEEEGGYVGRGRAAGQMSMQERGRRGAAVKNQRLRQGYYEQRV